MVSCSARKEARDTRGSARGIRLGILTADDAAADELGGQDGEHRGQEHTEQGVEPDERDEEGAEAQAYPDDAEWSVRFQSHPLEVRDVGATVTNNVCDGEAESQSRPGAAQGKSGTPAGSRRAADGYLSWMSTRSVRQVRMPPAATPGRRESPLVAAVRDAVGDALAGHPRVVLAVSGGRDSMVMLDAAARVRDRIVAVATFDHGTGRAAANAAALVERRGAELALRVIRGSSAARLDGEAAWREARWRFLREVAAREEARVATAHTLDDQVETVLMRAMRGAGARGLAALYAPGDVLRPLLALPRGTVAAYAAQRGVSWLDDPSNQSRRFLRNRVRLDLLPALTAADPQLPGALIRLAREAAVLRRDVEAVVDRELAPRVGPGGLQVARAGLLRYDEHELRLLCPALVARVGVTLDRRGTRRLAQFITTGRRGSQMQLSGGYDVVIHRDTVVVRRHPSGRGAMSRSALFSAGSFEIDGWRFVRLDAGASEVPLANAGLWAAVLPANRALVVRPWQPGDRMVPLGAVGLRRVKGLLRDAGLDGPSRIGWPVVLADDQIVWIPGVRRSSAATARPGRPEFVYLCERTHC